MKERPILFSTPMVQALLQGRKAQTRRIMKPQPKFDEQIEILKLNNTLECPYGDKGDILWVREKWQRAPSEKCYCPQPSEPSPCDEWVDGIGCKTRLFGYVYAADETQAPYWKPSIHMPRTACRLYLEITNIRVERLQDISWTDCVSEGIEKLNQSMQQILMNGVQYRDYLSKEVFQDGLHEKESFKSLWRSINGVESWPSNPWVWVIEFKRKTT